MASVDLGKVAVTSGGNYSSSTTYGILTTVVGTDGRAYITKADNVVGISPGVTSGWQNYWVLFAERGIGISDISLTGSAGLVDTYTITYDNGDAESFTVTNGNSATFTIGATTTGAPGTQAAVTNSGTPNAGVLNFTIPAGQGVASGGNAGQVLAKASGTDYDTEWSDVAGLLIDDNTASDVTAYSSQKCEATFAKTLSVISTSASTSGWSSSAPYTQTVTATGILASDSPIAYVYMADNPSASVGAARMEAYQCVGRIACSANAITLYCYDEKPTTAFQVMLKVVR